MVWGRLWGSGAAPVRVTPICLLPREDLEAWEGLAGRVEEPRLGWPARAILEVLRTRGAMFSQDLQRASRLLPSHFEMGLEELISRGLLSNDAFAALRQLLTPSSRRKGPLVPAGRWTLIRQEEAPAASAEFVARRLLDRTGVVFRRITLRERQPLPWRELVRSLRLLELRGEVRGGRFVAGFSGEQFALPEAVTLLREVRRRAGPTVTVSAADPLNLRGILTPDERIPPGSKQSVQVG